ncbi:MAG: hypothetical protein KME45_13610 [Stenomitos rutilans HA7619-LM2]|nr:hypothetical protein [Stenomitos rutilans HA7619-LM2]
MADGAIVKQSVSIATCRQQNRSPFNRAIVVLQARSVWLVVAKAFRQGMRDRIWPSLLPCIC